MTIDPGNVNQSFEEMMNRISIWTEEMLTRLQNLEPVLEPIGQEIILAIRAAQRDRQTPGGTPFLPLSQTTLRLYAEGPYQGSTGRLAASYMASVNGNEITFFNPLPYAATQMFGNPNNTLYGVPAPIPARPYLDLDEDGNIIFSEDIVRDWQQRIFTYIYEGEVI